MNKRSKGRGTHRHTARVLVLVFFFFVSREGMRCLGKREISGKEIIIYIATHKYTRAPGPTEGKVKKPCVYIYVCVCLLDSSARISLE